MSFQGVFEELAPKQVFTIPMLWKIFETVFSGMWTYYDVKYIEGEKKAVFGYCYGDETDTFISDDAHKCLMNGNMIRGKYHHKKFLNDKFGPYINSNDFDFLSTSFILLDVLEGKKLIKGKKLLSDNKILSKGSIQLLIDIAEWGFNKEVSNKLKNILKVELNNGDEGTTLLLLLIISLYPTDDTLESLFTFLNLRYQKYNFELHNWISKEGKVICPISEQSKNVQLDSKIGNDFESIADNHSYNVFVDAIKLTAIEMQKRAHEDCRLLPYGDDESERMELPTLDVETTVSSTKKEKIELVKLLQMSEGNVMITGSGGCGKTYSLLFCAEQILSSKDDKANIPFYIPLNTFNGSDFRGIEAYVIDKIKVCYDNDYTKAEQAYSKFLSEYGKNGRKLIFLCDGFNEVISKELQTKIVQNIKELQHNYIYRFVITSRYNLSSTFANISGDISNSGFTAYNVNDLDDDVVAEYVENFLRNQGISDGLIKKIVNDELCEASKDSESKIRHKVKDIYKKPMAIVMFCGLYSSSVYAINSPDFYSSINCLGELLHNFIMCIKIGNRSAENKDKHFSFLQYLGYRMNVDGVFTISRAAFNRYCEDFIKQFGMSDMSAQEIFQNTFVNDVMKYESGTNNLINAISFNHQNFRDYFAASFLREFICSGDCSRIAEFIGIEKKIPNETSLLLAELLGEYKIIEKDEVLSADNTYVQTLLRDNSSQLNPSAVAYLINLAVIGRKNDLSQFNFSGLDLSLTKLNGVELSVGSGKERTKAKFHNARITKETFAPVGHAGAPLVMFFVENRFVVSFSKNTICSFDMKTGVQRVVGEYSEEVILSAVHISNTNEIVTGDAVGILSLWRYGIVNDKLSLSLVKQYNLLDSVYMFAADDRKKRAKIQDICIWGNDQILFSISCGDVFSVDAELNNIPVLKLSLCSEGDEYSRFCRVKSNSKDFYVSYGNKVYKNKIEQCLTMPMAKGCIYDFLLVNIEGCLTVLANFRGDKNNPEGAVSVIYKFDEVQFNNSESSFIKSFKEESHSVSSQGFTGWNRFSSMLDDGYCAYLCANTNDDSMTPSVYKLSFEPIYDEDDEVEDIKVEYEAVFGNKHIMSVECVLPFTYNERKYLATSSTDRSVEVLDISATENTLIYHLPGYTDGVTCMKVVDDKTIYTSHYSGEVCKWHKNKANKWLCTIMSKPHTNWVWIVDCACTESERYIVGGSYDHSVSLTNDRTGNSLVLDGCKGHIKAMEIIDNSIIAAYDYKGDKTPVYELAVFSNVDFAEGKKHYQFIEAPGNGFVRCMKRIGDELFLCVNLTFESKFYCIKIGRDGNGVRLEMDSEGSVKSVLKNQIKSDKFKTQIRAIDVIDYNGERFFVCGGNVGNFFVELWNDKQPEKSKVTIQSRPPIVSYHNDSYDGNDGVSTIKFAEYNSELYIIAGAYDYHTYIYKLSINSNKINCNIVSVVEHSDKVMNIQYFEKTSQVYVSLFNGKVYTWDMESLVNSANTLINEESGELLFHAVTGLHIMGVDFTNHSANSDIPDDFKRIMRYYCKI